MSGTIQQVKGIVLSKGKGQRISVAEKNPRFVCFFHRFRLFMTNEIH